MIRILQYIGSLKTGGSQSMIMDIYRNIDRTLIQFDFVIHPEEDTYYRQMVHKLGGNFFVCPRFSLTSFFRYIKWWLLFFYKHPEYRIIHSHIRSTASIVLLIAKLNGRLGISHSHSMSNGRGIESFIKKILQYFIRFTGSYFIGCSYDAGQWLFGKKICSSDKYFTLKNGIIVDEYIFNAITRKKVRGRLQYKDSDFVIGHVGRLTEAKNHDFILEIFRRLHQFDSKYKLLLIGDGERRNDIEKKISQYNLNNKVILLGDVSNVSELLMGMDLFLFPSKWEGLGIAVIEAQASGCPCIVSDAIPAAAKITDLVTTCDLKLGADVWCEKIKKIKKVERKNMKSIIVNTGYDVRETTKFLQRFYYKLISNFRE